MNEDDLEKFDSTIHGELVDSEEESDDDSYRKFEVHCLHEEQEFGLSNGFIVRTIEGYLCILGFEITNSPRISVKKSKESTTIRQVKLFNLNSGQKDPTIVFGKNTNFTDIQIGKYLFFSGERQRIMKVFSATKLKVAGRFTSVIEYDIWHNFKIEQGSKMN